ncbi:NUDIX hydrolase [candidate division TA06 bacterium]|nr:NUDIX hydrolase [candidate division TA06 bacterium]
MNQNKYGWKTLSSKIVYKNPWITVRHDRISYPGGRKGIYGVVQKGPGVAVVAVNDAGRIYLVKQYRYALDNVFYELPAGAIHQGESALASAKRELWEEIGLKAAKWKRLGNFYTALGHENAEIIVYLARKLKHPKVSSLNQQHDESILEISEFSPAGVKKMIRSNRINCGITLAALNLFFLS